MVDEVRLRSLVQVISTNQIIRSRNLLAELENQNVVYKITEGVVPSQEQFAKGNLHSRTISSLICQRNISLGEVGCATAHRIAATNFINSGKDFGVVFEDDAEVLCKFEFQIINECLSSAKPRILILGWHPGYAVAYDPGSSKRESFLRLVTPTTCTFGYALNRAAATLIAEGTSTIIDLADWPVNIFQEIDFFIVGNPWVEASDNPNDSIIGVRAESLPTNKFVILARRIRLVYSFFALLVASRVYGLKLSSRQLIHRIFLRDFLYKFGRKQYELGLQSSNYGNIVLISERYRWLVKYLNRS